MALGSPIFPPNADQTSESVLPNIGADIRELRQQGGMSQQQLAAKIGCTVALLSKIETGDKTVDYGLLCQVSEAVGRQPELVLIGILQKRFPEFSHSDVGRLLDELAEAICRVRKS